MTYLPVNPYYQPIVSQFGEMETVSRTPQVELASIFPISTYRDAVAVGGSGTVTKSTSGSEYVLSTTALANDSADIHSAERGRYKPGYSVNVGIGIRAPTAPTGSQKAIWGYMDANNGFYFGVDATGNYLSYLNGGVETVFRQSAWNVDKLDGTGASGLTLDPTRGNIFQITFSWYGYGVIEWQVALADATLTQVLVTVHRYSPAHSTSIAVPNLPVGATVSNGTTAAAFSLYMGGRQISIVGLYTPNQRNTSATALSHATSTTRVPILTFQRNSTASLYIPVRLNGFDGIVGADSVIDVVLNGTLTGASYAPIPGITASETALQIDTSATAISGGSIVYSTLIGASGGGSNSKGTIAMTGISLDVPALQPLTLCARTIAGTSTASLIGRMIEDW